MAWVPIQEAGITFEFVPTDEFNGATLSASVVSIVDESMSNSGWSLFLDVAAALRVTAQSYASTALGQVDEFTWDGGGSQLNDAPDPAVAWLPSPFETGSTTELTFTAGASDGGYTYSFLIEVEVADPPVPPPTCQEIGRATRAYVSPYTRERIHQSRLYPQEKRCLIANFNGALPAGRTIVQAQWDIDAPYAVAMSNAFIAADGQFAGRETGVTLQAVWEGDQVIRCQATLDNGEIYTQLFYVQCLWRGWFGDTMPAAGPYRLVVTAP